ncbi:MAG: Ig-like domain-containing protein [Kofleriaceae bacterium]|nr:Ig-like domain-containing protein [Kofleriaceae bacterium]
MNTRLDHSLLVAVMLAATGCGTVDPEDTGMEPDEPDAPDTTAPSVVGTTPTANATGVGALATITVTFSEPMDPPTVAAAYTSAELPADKVEFHWNPEQTVLTIQPQGELEYAEGIGTDPNALAAKQYAVAIGTGAKDLVGNSLAAPMALSFATKKRMLASFPIDADLSRVIRDATVLSVANPIWIGDNNTGQTYRSYLTFDLTTLPANSEIEAAEFSARQAAPSGLPYGIGGVVAQHVTYASIEVAAAAQAMSLPGMFSEDPVLETKRLDITSQVSDDVTNRVARGNRSQFRLQIDTPTDSDGNIDTAVFTKDTFTLLALYLTP